MKPDPHLLWSTIVMVLQFCKSNLITDNKEERSIRSRLNDRFSQSSNSLPQVSCPSCIVSPIVCVHKVGGGGGGGVGWLHDGCHARALSSSGWSCGYRTYALHFLHGILPENCVVIDHVLGKLRSYLSITSSSPWNAHNVCNVWYFPNFHLVFHSGTIPSILWPHRC